MSSFEPTNPYAAPALLIVEGGRSTRRFRWQTVPSAICAIAAVLTLIVTMGLGWGTISDLRQHGLNARAYLGLASGVVFGLCGILFAVTSSLWLRSRWWSVSALTMIAFGLSALTLTIFVNLSESM